ncbi:MAG: hypothetical protein KF824_06000 [Fimbriimonadaceae bacterium]|nr:MAG: hypothetical protein KF824_06000 [Fimbriimonadaceae bacterium]
MNHSQPYVILYTQTPNELRPTEIRYDKKVVSKSRILRLILATVIVLGLIPAQAISDVCESFTNPHSCCATKTSCHKKPDSCPCFKPISQPDSPVILSASQPAPIIAVLSIPPISISQECAKPIEPSFPEPKANAPPGHPPDLCIPRAPPVL